MVFQLFGFFWGNRATVLGPRPCYSNCATLTRMATSTPHMITISGRNIPATAHDCEPELRRPSRSKRALAIEMAPFLSLAAGEPSLPRRRSKLGRLEATMAMLKLGPLTEGVCVCVCGSHSLSNCLLICLCTFCVCRTRSLPFLSLSLSVSPPVAHATPSPTRSPTFSLPLLVL